ncbi:MAG: AAA family ATPase, partial [Prevotellaceae bacterium]|nr:AAA family ATPase [Prevotellaceae bacterium]
MILERDITEKLAAWKNRDDRKPLILQGARQTGKTWALLDFGKKYFEHTAYFSFEDLKELKPEFEKTKNPDRLLGQLQLHTSAPILPEKTLIIFDEIQECNAALNSLKYFCENAPEYVIIAAGSLLGVAMSKGDSFPVGKVSFQKMYPVSFKEFLKCAKPDLFEFVENLQSVENLPLVIFNRLSEEFKKYHITGGMPAIVSNFLNNKGLEQVEYDLGLVLNAYALDFAKHAEPKDIPRITDIWNSIPSQLSRENRKFLYKLVK